MHSKFTDIQKADVIAQYWRGKPVSKICEEFAVSKSTVYAWIRPCSVKKEAAAVGRHVFIQKEMVNLQNKMCRLNTIIEILGKAECLRNAPLEDRLAEFHRLKGQYGTNILLEALNISKGTYHSRILHNSSPSPRRERYEYISNEVRAIFDESRQCYGADKILSVLQSRGVCTSKKYVLRIMRELGLTSIRAYSKHDYTAQRRKNVVSRKFSVEMPNQIWVGDVAQHMVKGVYFYICVVIDLFSRKVLAYRVSSCCSAKMITLTFKTAYAERGYPKGLIFHSDQGTQYTSAAFRGLLSSNGVPVIIQFDVSRPNENGYRLLFFVQLFSLWLCL